MTVSGIDIKRRTLITQIAMVFVVAIAVASLVAVFGSGDAQAAAFGELGQVGKFGTGSAGEFSWPSDMAVDTSNNSVYVLDEPGAVRSGGGPSSFRIQKFGASLGAPTASVTIPTPELPEEHHRIIAALAFDSQLHRLYVLEENELNEEEAFAGEIYAFTEALQPVANMTQVEIAGVKESVFYKFPAAGETGSLFAPHGLAVDPTTHDLIALGGGHGFMPTVLQRIAAGSSPYLAGTLGSTFEDTGKKISSSVSATGVSVAPDGSLFLSVHNLPGASHLPGVVKLSSNFATASIIASDSGVSGAVELTGGREGGVALDYGPQISAAPDEGLVYAVETNQSQPGSYEIRGMSTADGSQKVVFGGGTAPHCVIASVANAVIAGSGGVVYALDEGAFASGSPGHSSYGFDLVKFGPDGSGCPTPSASFKIGTDVSSPKVTVKKGESVSFTADGSGLNGEKPVELQWDLNGSGKYETKVTPISPEPTPSLHISQEYFTPGVYTIGLKIFLEHNGSFGNPPPVTREIEVVAEPPHANFEASSTDPKPEEAVTFNGELSYDPQGLCSAGHGCSRTSHLKKYIWKFGDGETIEKPGTEDTYSRKFANTSHQSRQETVTLTVINEEEVQSSPTTQSLTIQGTPENKEPTKEPTKETSTTPTTPTIPPPMPVVTPPVQKPLTNAQKLAKALKVCGKIKSKKKRAACVTQAKRRYGPKPKKKSKKK